MGFFYMSLSSSNPFLFALPQGEVDLCPIVILSNIWLKEKKDQKRLPKKWHKRLQLLTSVKFCHAAQLSEAGCLPVYQSNTNIPQTSCPGVWDLFLFVVAFVVF